MKKLKIIPPSVTMVKVCVCVYKYTPGFNNDLFKLIFLNSKSMKSQGKIVLSFDEVAKLNKNLNILTHWE